MLNKPEKLGNVETMFILAMVSETLAAMLESKAVKLSVGKGERYPVTPQQIANRTGYKKLTTYHHRILNQLAKQGWLEIEWHDRNRKNYSVGYQAWRTVGFMEIASAVKARWDMQVETPIPMSIINMEGKN